MKRLLVLLLFLGSFFPTLRAEAHYYRTESQVIDAIRDGNSHVSVETARSYAKVIIEECKDRHCDPFTMAAMAFYESGWNPRTINASDPGYSVGLMQIAAVRKNSPCSDKSLLDTKPCRDKIALLMVGTYNLRRGAMGITIRRKYCRDKTGHPSSFEGWLSSYQGYDSRPGIICNMKKDRRGRWVRLREIPWKTKRVMDLRRKYVRKFGGRRRAKGSRPNPPRPTSRTAALPQLGCGEDSSFSFSRQMRLPIASSTMDFACASPSSM
jgi:hypothetical protein